MQDDITSASSPQSMPVHPIGEASHRLHPRSVITNGLRYLRGLILPAIVVMISRGFSGDRVELAFTFGIPVAAAFLSMIAGGWHWAVFRYALTDRELEIRSGFVFRQQRIVPVERIQAVDFEEAPLERVLGLVRVRVETAASGHDAARIELNALGRHEAEALRTQLLAMRAHAGPTAPITATGEPASPTAPETSDVLYRLSVRDLILAGATSGRVGPAAAALGIAVQFGADLVPERWWDRVPWDSAAHADVRIIVLALVVAGIVAWGVAIGSTVLTFAGFELKKQGKQLIIRHGLLDRKRRTIPLARIQSVVTFESLLRQPFGFAEIRIESAGQAGQEDAASGVLVPFIRKRDIPALFAAATPEFVVPDGMSTSALVQLPTRAAQRYIMPSVYRAAAVWLAANAVTWWMLPNSLAVVRWWAVAAIILVPVAGLQGWLAYRTAGWGLTPAHLVLRWRSSLGRHTLVTRRQRLQHRGMSANPFQRRADLATFHTAVASGHSGGHFTLRHLEAADAAWLLTELEPSQTRAAMRVAAMNA